MKKIEKKITNYEKAKNIIREHYLLGSVAEHISFHTTYSQNTNNQNGVAILKSGGIVYINDKKKYSTNEWTGVLGLIVLHYALGYLKKQTENIWQEISHLISSYMFLQNIKGGTMELPLDFEVPNDFKQILNNKSDTWIYNYLKDAAQNKTLSKEILTLTFGLSTKETSLVYEDAKPQYFWTAPSNYEEIFANSIVEQAKKTLTLSAQKDWDENKKKQLNTNAQKAKKWFITHYPLLGAIASHFDIVEDEKICNRLDIHTAAIDSVCKEIYINPLAHLNFEELKFVIAHELLHAALLHMSRRQGREPFLWNVACDFVINGWLTELCVGTPPSNLMFDPDLHGLSADEIYLKLASDIRIQKKLRTLRGNKCDILDEERNKFYCDADEFCRSALQQGLDLHELQNRGTLPGGMEEDIKVVLQPPIPWNVALAEWIAEHFPSIESKRTYARPSRRQAATPDIPRASYVIPEEAYATRTYGVILDTSGSMDRQLLGKALGAIASYSQNNDVKTVRLIYADAQPYDEGYVSVDTLHNKVSVKGRGGTVLQKAINYILLQKDFPKDAPVLIITDGFCESTLNIEREHAFLIPQGQHLPFKTNKPIFKFS